MADYLYMNKISFTFFAVVYGVIYVLGIFTESRKIIFGLLAFVGGTLFINYFLTTHFGYWHMVEFVPFLCLSLGAAILKVSKMILKWKSSVIYITSLIIILGLYNITFSAIEFYKYDYDKLLKTIYHKVPQNAQVFAIELYKPAFKERLLGYNYDVDRPGTTCEPFPSVIKKINPDYVIFDDVLRGFMSSSCGETYEISAFKYLLETAKGSELIKINYPNYWAKNKLLKDIYIFKIH